MKKWTRWQDWVVVAAGVYVALSTLWTTQMGASMSFMLVLGVLMVAAGVWSLAMPGLVSMEWVHVALGALLIISPWVGNYASSAGAAWTSWIAGVVVLAAGLLAVQPAMKMHHVQPTH
ncbi:SPW repeat protein [Diaminobutyricibacter sp. McL0618]|uniref:SPW repeat protein n=1 Tax=Leifsonia sp. McL0618 TaxID=3415677 RepID=UPI003CF21EA8